MSANPYYDSLTPAEKDAYARGFSDGYMKAVERMQDKPDAPVTPKREPKFDFGMIGCGSHG